uniref:phage integrase central domain-containing protein n=1 Tax=Paraburkholderia phytofirmans TaxID=261302 RepID=UPI0038B7F4AF
MIVRILQPIWTRKAETARRVRGRIKAILDAETVLGHRTGSNPARYVDHLQLVLPRSKKRSQVRHHPALPWCVVRFPKRNTGTCFPDARKGTHCRTWRC